MKRIQELKCHPSSFNAVLSGAKPYEIRRNDRDYCVGDWLVLCEWDPSKDSVLRYTRRIVAAEVKYMSHGGQWGLPIDLCVLAIPAMVVLCAYARDVGRIIPCHRPLGHDGDCDSFRNDEWDQPVPPPSPTSKERE
jgi:hypothetical protein